MDILRDLVLMPAAMFGILLIVIKGKQWVDLLNGDTEDNEID
jgi:hypothetical protein